jgi:hypothetical protein
MKSITSLHLAVAALSLLISSCIPVPIGLGFQTKEVVSKNQPKNATAPPLEDWHAKGGVHFLLVHGMNNHPFGFIDSADTPNYLDRGSYAGLESYLRNWKGLPPEEKRRVAAVAKNSQFSDFIKTYSKRAGITIPDSQQLDFTPIFDSSNTSVSGYLLTLRGTHSSGTPVTFNVVCWSILSSVRKEAIYGAWSHAPGAAEGLLSDFKLDPLRNEVNRGIRRGVVVWGLTDASLYMSSSAPEFEWCVYQGVKRVIKGMDKKDRVAVVTASLGSTIAFNAIDKLVAGEPIAKARNAGLNDADQDQLKDLFRDDNGNDLTDQTRITFYMFANQFGLLGGGTAFTALQSAAKNAKASERHPVPIQVVSFTDPDDLLSMPFPTPRDPRYMVAQNVYVRNNRAVLGILIAGRATNPLNAHNGYGTNPAVLDTMLKGSVKSFRFPAWLPVQTNQGPEPGRTTTEASSPGHPGGAI